MKPIRLTESEKQNILRLHGSSILIEQSTGKTIADIQKLVGANPDNKLGPKTLAAIKAKLGQPNKVEATTTTTTIAPTDTKTPEAISMERMKVGSLTKGPTQSGLQVGVGRTGGTPEVKSGQLADKSGEKPKADDAVDSRNV